MFGALLGYIVGQTVVILAIAAWHLLRPCPCEEELDQELRQPLCPCRRQFRVLGQKDGPAACRCEQSDEVPGTD